MSNLFHFPRRRRRNCSLQIAPSFCHLHPRKKVFGCFAWHQQPFLQPSSTVRWRCTHTRLPKTEKGLFWNRRAEGAKSPPPLPCLNHHYRCRCCCFWWQQIFSLSISPEMHLHSLQDAPCSEKRDLPFWIAISAVICSCLDDDGRRRRESGGKEKAQMYI